MASGFGWDASGLGSLKAVAGRSHGTALTEGISTGPVWPAAHSSTERPVTNRTYARVSPGSDRRPPSQSRTRPDPALYAAAARPRFPNSRRRLRNSSPDFAIASSGSNGFSRPLDLAVGGMN